MNFRYAIADLLAHGKRPDYLSGLMGAVKEQRPDIAKLICDAADENSIATATRVDITALRAAAQSVAIDHTTPLRLPYGDMWIEYQEPPALIREYGILRTGLFLTQAEPNLIAVYEYTLANRKDLRGLTFNGHVAVEIDDDGYFVNAKFPIAATDRTGFLEDYGNQSLSWPLHAIALMNCKNVTLEDRPERQSAPRKRRKDKIPTLTFKTIHLPGMPSASGTKTGNHVELAHHLVRGHFKTYTDDKPLMGRLTGTYWWASHARGAKRNGIVSKDYAIHAPAEAAA